jgi:hypothetical protein
MIETGMEKNVCQATSKSAEVVNSYRWCRHGQRQPPEDQRRDAQTSPTVARTAPPSTENTVLIA